VKKAARAAGLDERVGCHSFRATGITTYLKRGGTPKNALRLAGHATPTTTKLCNRTGDEASIEEVEQLPSF
jgi:integrase